METPVYGFLKRTADAGLSRFFMPGHKGNPPYGGALAAAARYDLTEIAGADVLLQADGIIGESEQNAAGLFGSRATLYSTQGSTLCIQAMLALIAQRGDTVIAGRNAHQAFCHAALLLRIRVHWMLPQACDPYGVCGLITPEQVERALRDCPEAAAVYLTTPDYLGNTADLEAIAAVCHRHGVLLCCDNAHGAYLILSGAHPMQRGADLCCDSAHKTLPALTGGAYLHLGPGAPWDKRQAKEAMAPFASTSPSYLILASLDLCNRYLSDSAPEEFAAMRQRIEGLRQRLSRRGIRFLPVREDYAKLTLDAAAMGWKGEKLAGLLRRSRIEPEYANDCYVVLMGTPCLPDADWERLERALEALPAAPPVEWEAEPYTLPEAVLPPWEAWRRESEWVPVEAAAGRISAGIVSSCPPGVPVVLPGERISAATKKICENSGNFMLKVIK